MTRSGFRLIDQWFSGFRLPLSDRFAPSEGPKTVGFPLAASDKRIFR
jgi:hypothetical protein